MINRSNHKVGKLTRSSPVIPTKLVAKKAMMCLLSGVTPCAKRFSMINGRKVCNLGKNEGLSQHFLDLLWKWLENLKTCSPKWWFTVVISRDFQWVEKIQKRISQEITEMDAGSNNITPRNDHSLEARKDGINGLFFCIYPLIDISPMHVCFLLLVAPCLGCFSEHNCILTYFPDMSWKYLKPAHWWRSFQKLRLNIHSKNSSKWDNPMNVLNTTLLPQLRWLEFARIWQYYHPKFNISPEKGPF